MCRATFDFLWQNGVDGKCSRHITVNVGNAFSTEEGACVKHIFGGRFQKEEEQVNVCYACDRVPMCSLLSCWRNREREVTFFLLSALNWFYWRQAERDFATGASSFINSTIEIAA